MNTFLNELKEQDNFKLTENGAVAHKSTMNKVYDMFSLGGAYRNRDNSDCVKLFKDALEENETLALKCLFYLRDVRGGQGERRFFRVCYKWLCNFKQDIAKRNLEHIAEYGRWDDLINIAVDTPMEDYAFMLIKAQLFLDRDSKTPSLLGKWMPSENTSSRETRRIANKLRTYLKMKHKEYRKMLSDLRRKINIVERLMSSNQWDLIEFDKIPSKAGLIYKNAFARKDIIKEKYTTFARDEKTKVNADTLYPYEVVNKALDVISQSRYRNLREEDLQDTDRLMVNKYWENLKDYINGDRSNAICVCDTSGSMTPCYSGRGGIRPIDVAISLSIYMAERNKGPFANHYISFASRPQLIETSGVDFVDKVKRIYDTNLVDDTNLEAVFKLLKDIALRDNVKPEDIPERVIVISDMEINAATDYDNRWTQERANTLMENIREDWAAAGLKMPSLVYWNVDARNNTILDSGDSVSFVSGASPVLFEQICKGVTGWDLCLDKLLSERYSIIK